MYSCLSGPHFQSEWNIKYDPNPPCQLASPQQSLGVPTAFAINFADVTLFWPEPLRLNSDSGPYMNQMRYNCRFSHRWCYLYCGRTETPSRIPNHTTVGGNPFINTVLVLYLCPWFCLLLDISIYIYNMLTHVDHLIPGDSMPHKAFISLSSSLKSRVGQPRPLESLE